MIGSTLLILLGWFHHSHTRDDIHSHQTHTLKVGGTPDMIERVQSLTEAYTNQTDAIAFDVMPGNSPQTILDQVQSNVLDLGMINHSLTSEEQNTVTYIPLGSVPLSVVVHDSVTNVVEINSTELQAIYQGEITNWQAVGGPDAEIVVFDIPETTPAKGMFRETYLGDELVITADAIVLADERESLDMAATTDFSIALVPLSNHLESVALNPIAIEGASGTDDLSNNAQGTDMSLPIGMVLPLEPMAEVQDFIEFAQSAEGQDSFAYKSF